MLTHVRGAHVLKVGYEGWFGDDVEPFEGPWSHPSFSFNNLLALAQDAPATESGVMYNPITGQQQLWNWNAASKTWGLFAEDTWKARRNLTLTLGFRFDDQGNPYSRSAATVFGNFHLGTGSTFAEEVANGVATPSKTGSGSERRKHIRPESVQLGTSPERVTGWSAAASECIRIGSRRRTFRRSSAEIRRG